MNYLEIRLDEFGSEELFKGKENSCILNPEKLADLRELYQNVRTRVEDAKQFMKSSEEKPILTKLIEILRSEKPTSRIIVFVDMRKVGSDLSKYLNTRPEIIELFGRNKVGYIASTNQASSRFGQTQAEQQLMLEKFKDGSINILVATSVAEEGLDVAACNMVLKYNSVGSEKSLTQRKGRARAKGSKAILLALEEKTMRREFENVRKEVLMNICIQALQVMSEHELTRRIKEKFEEMKAIAVEDKRRDEECKNYRNQIYELCCKECSRVFCKSDEIFSLNNNEYICCNRECWNDTKIKRRIGQKEKGNMVTIQCGEWLCYCGHRRGNVIKYGGTYLPTISSASFTIKLFDGPHETFPTKNTSWDWLKQHKFNVSPITTKELHEMAASLFNLQPTNV
uniref:RNA helicase n=1 Tax=Panagrolaimus superbus TaxID=310955 RepID=A0A914Y6R1_9BILA